uniref:Uncharacterized protein n=1 Tax=Clytia hemisphaerica TaxID=252671 RepID=A0A7M5XMA2_9CNID
MAISKSSTLFIAAIILSITVCQVSCMRHHHVERRAGDASKDMAKEECDMLANDMLQKYKDKPYTEARDPFLDFFKKCIIQLFDFQMEANPARRQNMVKILPLA